MMPIFSFLSHGSFSRLSRPLDARNSQEIFIWFYRGFPGFCMDYSVTLDMTVSLTCATVRGFAGLKPVMRF